MTTALEYREFAQECLRSADTAPSEDERKAFLQMAKLWIEAAQQAEQGIPVMVDTPSVAAQPN